jgi:superfamily II DNA or RNA helicase
LAQAYQDAGISAAHLDGDTDLDTRREILGLFAVGEIKVLCQHSIVTEGTDIVGIECLQFLRPTKSISLWFQAIGRALRPAPGKCAIIIDHTDTHLMLPWPDDEIEWSLDPISLSPGKFTIRCPHCHHVFRPHLVERAAQQANCPVCQQGFELIPGVGGEGEIEPISSPEVLAASFEEISNEYNAQKLAEIQKIIEEQKRRGFQRGWVYYRLREIAPAMDLSLSDWREISRRLGYKPGWGWHQWMEMQVQR